MTGELYNVTIKYELRLTRGELVPSAEDVQVAVLKQLEEGDELHVHVEREVEKTEPDGFGDPQPTGEKIKRFEGCRVGVDSVEVQSAVAL